MNKVALLFRKDLTERASFLKQSVRERDTLGTISSLLLIAFIYGVFIYVFINFAKMYLGTVFSVPSAGYDRLYELLTLVFGIVIIVDIIAGMRKIHAAVSDTRECDVLMCQPIGARSIFAYKLVKIYAQQVFYTVLIIIPVAVVLDVLSPYAGGVGYYFLQLVTVILAPALSCALAALFSVPYNACARFIDDKFIIKLLIYVVVLALGFWLYSRFLNVLSALLNDGGIDYVFDRNAINTIHKVCVNAYPLKFFTNIVLRTHGWESAFILVLASAASAAAAFFIVQRLYNYLLQKAMEGSVKVYRARRHYVKRNSICALLYKEFVTVLRTPSYAFQYFATTLTLPFMVYVCVNLLRSMMSTITVLDCDMELAIFVLTMFAILTNTFCTTNVSRDGKMFAMLKTMPLTCRQIVGAKLIFCSAVSVTAMLASIITLSAVGYLNGWQSVFVFFIGTLLSIAEIAYATRSDLNRPAFPTNERDEVTQSNSNVSTVVLIGLLVSALIGGGTVALTTYLSFVSTLKVAVGAVIGSVSAAVIIIFALSFVYLFKGLDKKYYSSEL